MPKRVGDPPLQGGGPPTDKNQQRSVFDPLDLDHPDSVTYDLIMSRRPFLIAVAALLIATTAVSAQSLADLARREEERRKAIKTPAKVYTNDDLRRLAAPGTTVTVEVPPATPADATGPAQAAPAPPPAATPAAEAPPAGPPAAAAASGAKDEKYWRGRIADARLQLDRNKGYAEAMQSRINGLTTDFSARDDFAQRAVIGANRQKALAELDRLNKEATADTKRITDIQEEARRAGVPAGWVR